MKLAALLEALQKSGYDPTPDSILDALWLASGPSRLGCGETLTFDEPQDGGTDPAREDGGPALPPQPQPPPPPHTPNDSARSPDHAPQSDQGAAYPSFGSSPEDRTVPASPLRLPSSRSLPNRLALSRALRPFQQRWPSLCDFDLDEERTSELTAELRRLLRHSLFPVTKPRMERWYEAHLVIEDEPSVEIWAGPLREFAQTLRDNGAFRLIRTWRLHLDPSNPADLGRAVLENPAGGLTPVRHLQGSPRRLIFFASHGASDHWLDGSYAGLLASWSAASLAMLHLLPRERWVGTTLGNVHGTGWAEHAGASSKTLKIRAAYWRDGADPSRPQTVRLPVTTLDPHGLGEWARMQMARGRQAPVYLLDSSEAMGFDALPEEKLDDHAIERRLVNLREQSPGGYHLAMLLSAAPFTLPVARVIQETVLGTATDYGLLANILLSGLVTARRTGKGSAGETTAFEFVPQARTILQRGVREDDGMIVFRELERRVSEHLEAKTGQGLSFEALRNDPEGQRSLPVWARHFAQVGLALARRRAEPLQFDLDQLMRDLDGQILARLARYVRRGLGPPAMDAQFREMLLESGAITSDDAGRLAVHRELAAYLEARTDELPLLATRLLWVDDRPMNNRSELTALEELGLADYKLALTTQEALGRIDIGEFDVIISDMARPPEREAGLDLIAGLRGYGIDTPVIIYAGKFASRDSNRRRVEDAGGFGCTNTPSELVALVLEAADLAERIARERSEAADADSLARLDAVRARLISLVRARAAAHVPTDPAATRLAKLLSAIGLDDRRVGELAYSAPVDFVSRWAGIADSETQGLPNLVLLFLDTITDAGYAQLFEISPPSEDGEQRIELIAERIAQGQARYRLASWHGVIGRAATGKFFWVPDVTHDSRYIRAEPSTRSELAASLKLDGFGPLVVNLEFRRTNALGEEALAWLHHLFEALRDSDWSWAQPPVAQASVLLARVTDDLEEKRRRLCSYLQQFHINVLLPEEGSDYQKENIDLAEAFRRQLESEPIVVQLLGPAPARRTPNLPEGFDGLQARLARDHSGVRLYQWRDPNLEVFSIADDQHRALVERAHAMGFEDFKAMITRRAIAARASSTPAPDQPSDSFLFVDADQEDEEAAREVLGWCLERGIAAGMPRFGIDSGRDWQNNYANATVLILIHISRGPEWLSARFQLFMKASARSPRPPQCLLYVSGPALSAGGARTIHSPRLEVIEAPDLHLAPLFARLEQWTDGSGR